MQGGTIRNNYARDGGGGIFIDGVVLNISSGGAIIDNRSDNDGGGIRSCGNSNITLSGNVNISGNKKDSTNSNIYLAEGSMIKPATDFDPSNKIGIFMSSPAAFTTDTGKTYGTNAAAREDFLSEKEGYRIYAES